MATGQPFEGQDGSGPGRQTQRRRLRYQRQRARGRPQSKVRPRWPTGASTTWSIRRVLRARPARPEQAPTAQAGRRDQPRGVVAAEGAEALRRERPARGFEVLPMRRALQRAKTVRRLRCDVRQAQLSHLPALWFVRPLRVEKTSCVHNQGIAGATSSNVGRLLRVRSCESGRLLRMPRYPAVHYVSRNG